MVVCELWNSEGFKGYLSKRANECLMADDGPKELIQLGDDRESEVAVLWISPPTVWNQ